MAGSHTVRNLSTRSDGMEWKMKLDGPEGIEQYEIIAWKPAT
jgi:hypothetical protein